MKVKIDIYFSRGTENFGPQEKIIKLQGNDSIGYSKINK